MKYLSFLFVFALFFACNQPTAQKAAEATVPDDNYFGEKITMDEVVAFDDLVQEMAMQDSMFVKVRGTVEEVCQAKGCWMNIVSESSEQAMFVKFKDYGFFVPKDIAGKEVVMEGYAYKEVTPVDELRHYAEDKGATADELAAITDPKEEFKFMASGVILLED